MPVGSQLLDSVWQGDLSPDCVTVVTRTAADDHLFPPTVLLRGAAELAFMFSRDAKTTAITTLKECLNLLASLWNLRWFDRFIVDVCATLGRFSLPSKRTSDTANCFNAVESAARGTHATGTFLCCAVPQQQTELSGVTLC